MKRRNRDRDRDRDAQGEAGQVTKEAEIGVVQP